MPKTEYHALPKLKIEGQAVPPELQEDLLQIVVEESLSQPGMFVLVIKNDYQPGSSRDKPWKHQNLLQIGKTVSIGFSASTTQETTAKESETKGEILQGEITAIEVHFTEKTQAPIIVRGYDVSHRLHRGRFNRSFQNMTDSDIVKKMAKEVGIDTAQIDESGIPHDYLFQENQTNMEFLRERSSRLGFELFVQDGKLNFRKPKADNKALQLKWLKDLRSFQVRMTSAEQVKEVEVRAWDYRQKRSIVATAKTERLITETDQGKGSATSSKFHNKPTHPKMIVVDRPVVSPKEADHMAQALCNQLGGQFVCADAKAEGNPQIRVGRVVELKDMGAYSGKYYITETCHIYQERLYNTEFSVRGLRGGNILTTLVPKTRPQPGQTLLIGIVTDNQDPESWGRVKVKFPTLTEEHTSDWARVVSLGAGNHRGFDCLPEIDDEVLVAFEHGDIHRPFVLGGVWNGKDETPTKVGDSVQDSKVRLRTIKTRTGHQIQFVEEDHNDRKKGVYIETNGGHKIELIDSDRKVGIQSTGDLKIDAKGNIDISATGVITVKGQLIKLN
jgi:phage protein D/phage baseplate assembly protein gpV